MSAPIGELGVTLKMSRQFIVKSEIKFIELKTGYQDDGPAWIGKVEFSRSGKTIYFNGHAFKGNGHGGCTDLETNEVYWISGIKRNGQDRHWAGTGKIMIDRTVVDAYLKLVELDTLDLKKYEVVDIVVTDKKKFDAIENKAERPFKPNR